MRKKQTVYAIIRIEKDSNNIESMVNVKEIVFDFNFAESEVKRLNELNRDKNCYYFCQTTRLVLKE